MVAKEQRTANTHRRSDPEILCVAEQHRPGRFKVTGGRDQRLMADPIRLNRWSDSGLLHQTSGVRTHGNRWPARRFAFRSLLGMAMTGVLIATILRVYRKGASDENRNQNWNQAPHTAFQTAALGGVT